VDIEKKNKPSKWITYFALKTLYKEYNTPHYSEAI
ncbi:unnamed protein product, partial [marine sediment metagenome]